jgi:AraC-like DNA-binding protein
MRSRQSQNQSDWVAHDQPTAGVERIEAFFQGNAYAMHRHDTYAIGRTLAGVQSFHYQKSMRHSLPGHTIVLHPDEPHDGQAGTHEGFRYRMIYIEPALFQDVLGGKTLPFIDSGVSTDPRLYYALEVLLPRMSSPLQPLEQDEALAELALALAAVSDASPVSASRCFASARRAREYLHAHLEQQVTLDELEQATGRERWRLIRDFRAFYSTSPYRYLTMRRLEVARKRMLQGCTLTDAAMGAGFADQSHMTRHFAKTYGMSPGRWLQIARAQANCVVI